MDNESKAHRTLQVLSNHLKPASLHLLECNYSTDSQSCQQHQTTYQYTNDNSLLTKQQRDFYEKNGFLVVKNLVSPHNLQRYHDR